MGFFHKFHETKFFSKIVHEGLTYLHLGEGVKIAKGMKDAPYDQDRYYLFRLALAAIKVAKETKDFSYLEKWAKIAREIEGAYLRAEALIELTKYACELKLWKKALGYTEFISNEYRILGYIWILRMREEERRRELVQSTKSQSE